MKRVLHVTLARNDNKPDNRILAVLDSIKAHGFEMTSQPMCHSGRVAGSCKWRSNGLYRRRREALASLAAELGQNEVTEKDINGLGLTLARHDGGPDNKLGHLYCAGRVLGFDFFLPRYVGTRRDIVYLEYTFSGKLPIVEALARLAVSLGQANAKLDGTGIDFSTSIADQALKAA